MMRLQKPRPRVTAGVAHDKDPPAQMLLVSSIGLNFAVVHRQ